MDYFRMKLRGHDFGNAMTADDIIYETIMRLLIQERKGNTRNVKNPKAYVSRVFYNVIANCVRDLRKNGPVLQTWDEQTLTMKTVVVRREVPLDDKLLSQIEENVATEDAIVSRSKYYNNAIEMIGLAKRILKGQRKEVFLSKVEEGLKLREIAEKYGISPNNAKQLYNRAKSQLKDAVHQELKKEELHEQERF